ncbi:NAD-dependent epimerase/dehydratase family protein [Azotosporobacter soli]|uniref:NAD-dependent epimerase/dehydratase family protein n=1 Tax=Azotosporobacter soli TaxID=3055040 RepID=UPI0031FEC263
MGKTAMLVGATGLVGGILLKRLLADPRYDKIVVVCRKTAWREGGKLIVREGDFSRLEELTADLTVDDVYCALGSTRKKAGSKAAFVNVDYEYPLQLAQLALKKGAKRFLLVSSAGASAKSRFFYLRTKGALEDALAKLSFEMLVIARPSLLLGKRSEFRLGEWLLLRINRFLPLAWRGVEAQQVAVSLIEAANSGRGGCKVITAAQLRRIETR